MNMGLIAGAVAAVAVAVALFCWRGLNNARDEVARLESAIELYKRADAQGRKSVDEFLTRKDETGKANEQKKHELDGAGALSDVDFWSTLDRVFYESSVARGDRPAANTATAGK